MKRAICVFGFLFLSLTRLASARGACIALPKPQPLHLVSPARGVQTKDPQVQVLIHVENDSLIVDFDVHSNLVNAKKLGPGEYPFQHDVVEVFVSPNGEARFPYYEFELSPLGETFVVRVDDLKKPFVNGVDVGLSASTKRTALGWSGELAIPLVRIGATDLSKLTGNAYGIFGLKPNRTFWSLSLPPQSKVNFHQPQFFIPLLVCAP